MLGNRAPVEVMKSAREELETVVDAYGNGPDGCEQALERGVVLYVKAYGDVGREGDEIGSGLSAEEREMVLGMRLKKACEPFVETGELRRRRGQLVSAVKGPGSGGMEFAACVLYLAAKRRARGAVQGMGAAA